MNDAKVYSAAFLGMVTSLTSSFVDKIEPWLNLLIHLGQIGVAVVTILYIYSKWKKNRK